MASGDPLHDRVIPWTRATPKQWTDEVQGRWYVATDARMKRVCCSGRFATDITRDFTVKIDVHGLDPGRTYYYQFETRGSSSPIGRTRTLRSAKAGALRLAFVSCANFPYGYFNAYARIAERNDLDFVVHLGDYIYEYALGEYGDPALAGLRDVKPVNEIVSLLDYRMRHALYKTDADLQEVHRQHPFICVWDDHEAANDAYRNGAENHNPEQGEGSWQVRRRHAVRAYNEYMPIRSRSAFDDQVYRHFQIGDLADLIMLDTRLHGRDKQAAFKTGTADLPVTDPIISDPQRTLLDRPGAMAGAQAVEFQAARHALAHPRTASDDGAAQRHVRPDHHQPGPMGRLRAGAAATVPQFHRQRHPQQRGAHG